MQSVLLNYAQLVYITNFHHLPKAFGIPYEAYKRDILSFLS